MPCGARPARAGLLSDEHFTVDGTQLEAWASLKSVRPRAALAGPPPDAPGNPTVNFHGERRRKFLAQRPVDGHVVPPRFRPAKTASRTRAAAPIDTAAQQEQSQEHMRQRRCDGHHRRAGVALEVANCCEPRLERRIRRGAQTGVVVDR